MLPKSVNLLLLEPGGGLYMAREIYGSREHNPSLLHGVELATFFFFLICLTVQALLYIYFLPPLTFYFFLFFTDILD